MFNPELKNYLLSGAQAKKYSNPVGITAVGAYMPEKNLTNAEIAIEVPAEVNFDQAFGIFNRRVGENETPGSMATKAALNAVEKFNVDPKTIDLVIATHASKNIEQLTPPIAAEVQTGIGAVNAGAFNVDCGYNGFLPSVFTAIAFVQAGIYNKVLVVAGETLMDNVDFSDFKALTIGDGAGAVIIEKVEEGYGFLATHHMSRGAEKAAGIKIKAGNPSYSSKQNSVKAYQYVEPISLQRDVPFLQRYIPASIQESLEVINLDKDKVDHFIFGQQFAGLTYSWIQNLGIDGARVFETLKDFAAMKTASIPVNIFEAYSKGILKKGDLIALGDQGANWYISSAILRWSI